MNERLYKLFAGLLLISSILIAQEILKITEDAPVFSEPNNNSQVIALAKKVKKVVFIRFVIVHL